MNTTWWITSLFGFGGEKAMEPHSSTLAWKIPWEEHGGLQSTGSQRVGHNWVTSLKPPLQLQNIFVVFSLAGRNSLQFYGKGVSETKMNSFIPCPPNLRLWFLISHSNMLWIPGELSWSGGFKSIDKASSYLFLFQLLLLSLPLLLLLLILYCVYL